MFVRSHYSSNIPPLIISLIAALAASDAFFSRHHDHKAHIHLYYIIILSIECKLPVADQIGQRNFRMIHQPENGLGR